MGSAAAIRTKGLATILSIALVVLVAGLAQPARAGGIFVVNSAADKSDAAPGNGACNTGSTITRTDPVSGATTNEPECTLRAAIQEGNALTGGDDVFFDIASSNKTIKPTSPLPEVTESLEIDARSQPGYAGAPVVELNGSSAGISDGLRISGDDSLVAGLAINRFSEDGVRLGRGLDKDVVDNYIGTTLDGTAAAGNGKNGVSVSSVTDADIDDNVISGNGLAGVAISSGSTEVDVTDNKIGTNAAGTSRLGNGFEGV